MRKWPVVGLLVVGSLVLGATVFQAPIAGAAQTVAATIVGPLDSNGNVKVHEQGTAQVAGTVSLGTTDSTNLTNVATAAGKLAFDGNGNLKTVGSEPTPVSTDQHDIASGADYQNFTFTASLIMLDGISSNTEDVVFRLHGNEVLDVRGPASYGQDHIVLPLTQPIEFDYITCVPKPQTGNCQISYSVSGFQTVNN